MRHLDNDHGNYEQLAASINGQQLGAGNTGPAATLDRFIVDTGHGADSTPTMNADTGYGSDRAGSQEEGLDGYEPAPLVVAPLQQQQRLRQTGGGAPFRPAMVNAYLGGRGFPLSLSSSSGLSNKRGEDARQARFVAPTPMYVGIGLGKRAGEDRLFDMGLGKRANDDRMFDMGLGKRATVSSSIYDLLDYRLFGLPASGDDSSTFVTLFLIVSLYFPVPFPNSPEFAGGSLSFNDTTLDWENEFRPARPGMISASANDDTNTTTTIINNNYNNPINNTSLKVTGLNEVTMIYCANLDHE